MPDHESQSAEPLSDSAETAGNESPASEESPPAAADDALLKAQTEAQELRNQALRAQAELDNYRKRMQREMEDFRRYSNADLMRDLLPVKDNMERALTSAGESTEAAQLLEGVRMVLDQFGSVLERHHCRKIAALGETFDPNLHEAIAQFASDEHAAGTVMQVAQDGYKLHDRVVRPAQVVVAKSNDSAQGE